MFTNEDLTEAIKKGIFTEASVVEFRTQLSSSRNSPSIDEENFRLISGFNDIFVVIACALLLFSSMWALHSQYELLSLIIFPLLAWGLGEYFVLKRKMALPAIMLLMCFVGGVFVLCYLLTESLATEVSFTIATAAAGIAAYFHWLRFKVPITVAAGTAAIIGFVIASVLSIFPNLKEWYLVGAFVGGIIAFLFAMWWDASDRKRITQRSDVAFWLHLLAAPLIIHPVFSTLGILDGNENLTSMVIVIALYLLMTFISVVVDRRAFMVSSLIYVLYALSSLLKAYGVVGQSFAVTGVVIGAVLLLLSAYWHKARVWLVSLLPASIQKYLPEAKVT